MKSIGKTRMMVTQHTYIALWENPYIEIFCSLHAKVGIFLAIYCCNTIIHLLLQLFLLLGFIFKITSFFYYSMFVIAHTFQVWLLH